MFRSLVSSAFRVSTKTQLFAQQTSNIPVHCFSTTTGVVKWFDSKKGFGFIVPDDGSKDVFVHQSAIHAEGFRSLAEGEPVEFSVVTDNNGRSKADNVTGPMGGYVQGAPRPGPRVFHNTRFGASNNFDDHHDDYDDRKENK